MIADTNDLDLWSEVPQAGHKGLERHVLVPLRDLVSQLDEIASQLGLRYAWEVSTRHGFDRHFLAGVDRWSAAATAAGFDAPRLLRAHDEYRQLVAKLHDYQQWGEC